MWLYFLMADHGVFWSKNYIYGELMVFVVKFFD